MRIQVIFGLLCTVILVAAVTYVAYDIIQYGQEFNEQMKMRMLYELPPKR